jgi:hypothetical protein
MNFPGGRHIFGARRAVLERSLWAALGFATVLSGCSAGTIIERLPASMQPPADAPARPETPYPYPAVHDMPPDRATVPMTEEEQVKLEKDLAKARDRQEGHPAAKKAATTLKKPPKDAQSGQSDGAKANP